MRTQVGLVIAPVILMLAACGTTIQSSGGVTPGKSIQPNSKVLVMALSDAVDKGGSTIEFVMGMQNCSFQEATAHIERWFSMSGRRSSDSSPWPSFAPWPKERRSETRRSE